MLWITQILMIATAVFVLMLILDEKICNSKMVKKLAKFEKKLKGKIYKGKNSTKNILGENGSKTKQRPRGMSVFSEWGRSSIDDALVLEEEEEARIVKKIKFCLENKENIRGKKLKGKKLKGKMGSGRKKNIREFEGLRDFWFERSVEEDKKGERVTSFEEIGVDLQAYLSRKKHEQRDRKLRNLYTEFNY